MGLFDFLKKKNKGIEETEFNSQQFQNEACALALWKLEENNGNKNEAIIELKKVGLNDAQIDLVLNKANQILDIRKQEELDQGGIDESTFRSDGFQKEIIGASIEFYFKNRNKFELVKQDLLTKGLSNKQADQVISNVKIRLNEMVNDFQSQLDSGAITEIKIQPNPEHNASNVNSEQVDKYIAYGAFQLDRGDLENALELFDKAIELDDKAVLAYANKGALYAKKEDVSKALAFYNKALEIDPNNIQVLENKMDFLFEIMNEQNENEFIDTAKNILKVEPNHPNALIYVIQKHLKDQDFENALDGIKKLFANYHSESIAIQLLLETFHKLPHERAMSEFSIYKNEINEHAQYQLEYCKGLYLMGVKEYEQAISLYEDLNKIHEFSWNYYQIAISQNFLDKTEECLLYLEKTFALEAGLKEDAKQVPYFQNLSDNKRFMELTK